MIQIPRVKSSTDNIEELRKELNAIIVQIEDQVNRELNNLNDELSKKQA